MRILAALAVSLLVLDVSAQSVARPRPPGTVPLDDGPPPPAMVESEKVDPALEPQITVRTEGDRTIQEYRVKGKLYMQRVTPRNGRPYVLMDNKGDGTFTKQDNTLDSGVRVPQWVLLEF